MSLLSVAVLGAGSMGESLLRGMTRSGTTPVDGAIHATCYSTGRAEQLRKYDDVIVTSVADDADANRRAAGATELVVVAVSPDRVPVVLDEISDSIRPGAVLVSVAAGVTLATLASRLPESVTVVRAIPNVGGKVGLGVTGVGTHAGCGDAPLGQVRALFGTVGAVVTVRDDQLDALSSIAGSGPAYFYYFVQQLAAAGIELGFSAEQAQILAEQTFTGAAALLHESGASPDELLREFTDPEGTTIRALDVLSGAGLKELLVEAASASRARAEQIGQTVRTMNTEHGA